MTRQCDWRIRDLVKGESPATLYLVVPPSDISRTKPLVRLILNQIGRRLTEELEPKRLALRPARRRWSMLFSPKSPRAAIASSS